MSSDSSLLANKPTAFIMAALLATATAGPAWANAANDTYTWSAELVSVDEAARTVTVQAPVVSDAELELDGLDGGDRATLRWSGITTAAGISRVTRGDASEQDFLTLPVEFVSAELDGRYVRFAVPVPSDDFSKLAALSPGQWITATSPRGVGNHEEAVVDMRPYNDVG